MTAGVRGALVALGLMGLLAASGTFFTVREGEQVLIVRQGAPVGVIEAPGLHAKWPLIDTVVWYDARLLTLEPQPEQVILGDQKRIVVQPFMRYRIADALRFNQAARAVDMVKPQLEQILSSSMRRVLGQVPLPSLLSEQRTLIVQRIQQDVHDKAKALGLDVAEVRLHRADLPKETSQAIYDRMKSERQREAKELRAQGFEWAQGIQSNADRERTVILSEAERQAKITRGEADARANEVLSKAYGQDPQFYKLYRSLQTYRQGLAESGATLVVSPDAAFLHAFKAGPDANVGR